MKYIFLENEDFIKYADFNGGIVYLLNKTRDDAEYPEGLIVNEISESFDSSAVKLPAMLSYANQHYLENYKITTFSTDKETGEPVEDVTFSEPFEYEVLTDNRDKYYIQMCVCDEKAIKLPVGKDKDRPLDKADPVCI